jgi:glutathione S-transferase
MKLLGSKTSPYVRKIRVLLAEKQIAFEFVEDNVWSPETRVPPHNPIGKVPTLILDEGGVLYDSRVIAEYLDALPGAQFIPTPIGERVRVRCDEALGDGITDAGIAIFLERKREAARQDPAWIARQSGKVRSGVAALSKAIGARSATGPQPMSLGDIACGCALFWLEFRLPEFRWREDPVLEAWARTLESRASFSTTRPPPS